MDLAGRGKEVTAELSSVDYLDGAGAGLLMELSLRAGSFRRVGLADEYEKLAGLFNAEELAAKPEERTQPGFLDELGRHGAQLGRDVKDLTAFLGETVSALAGALARPDRIRWKDLLFIAKRTGVDALPIMALIGTVLGLVMAFQSAATLQRFGADVFVANLLTISITRELGPLVTAILLAGRSGSAFSAELGTMKINEEVDALSTMGLDPVRFLAVPRILAAVTVTPLLTVFFELFALIGGGVVVTGFGYPLVTYIQRVETAFRLGDFAGGLVKATLFGFLVAWIGCRRGLAAGSGASAVGEATTSSVVSGLVLIAVADGVVAVAYYALGI